MPRDSLKPAIRAALRIHEIGQQSPYCLSFAATGKSGGSFGFMQGDLAAGPPVVRTTFTAVMARAGVDAGAIAHMLSLLSAHCLDNPLTTAETRQVNHALAADPKLVDAMDETLLNTLYENLDRCIAAAAQGGRALAAVALLYAALWINMSGPPSKLLVWLAGGDPELSVPVAPPSSQVISGADLRAYLMATAYYRVHPGYAAHLDEAVKAGQQQLPPGTTTA